MDQQDNQAFSSPKVSDTSRAPPDHAGMLLGSTLACTLAALALLIAPLAAETLPVLAISSLAAMVLLAAAGFAATLLTVHTGSDDARRVSWLQPALALAGGLLAGAIILGAWHRPSIPPGEPWLVVGGLMLVLAFPVLVLERWYAGSSATALPQASGLAALLRAVLLVQLGLGMALVLLGSGISAAAALIPGCAVLVVVVAGEFVLRGIAALFVPPGPAGARLAAKSSVAACIRLRRLRFASVNQAITRQWGIDLSRSWALGFAGRALGPMAVLMVLLAWGLTGLVALPLDQRAVYERLGRPVAVLGPGLHMLLPWPFGICRRVELGVMHELTLGGQGVPGDVATALPKAEDPPPQAADRLWDRPHPGETTYLIASAATSGQGFQRVDVDLRLITRIGLSDEAALRSAYGVADPDTLVRATASRLLARYFASRTLTGVLGEDRQTFADAVRRGLQLDLDRLATGIEVVAVMVEAIHPPPAAASAWHNVQSAEIRARVAIADETGAAAKTASGARIAARRTTSAAQAGAAEAVAKARVDQTLFIADHAANAASPAAFQLERWLTRLKSALPRAQLLVLDHHLDGSEAPTLDLRNLAPAVATPP